MINIDEKRYIIENFNFKVIYTKGHRNDLCTFYFYEDNIMFTGDFLLFNSIGRTDMKYGDANIMKSSSIKIKKYNPFFYV